MISEQAKQRMRELAARYPVARSAVMPSLYIAQQEEGYITQAGLEAVAEAIGLTIDDVESVATFYTMYYQQPPGKKVIKVCTSISCYLRNCDALVSHCEQRLGIKRGETTPDGNYTLMTTECLASCGTAPVLQVNNEFVENVTPAMIDALIDEWNNEFANVGVRFIAPPAPTANVGVQIIAPNTDIDEMTSATEKHPSAPNKRI
ncbi:MAG: NADH-quinone oxidoreductase subunit NuoE [Ktedonobacteraceae bacterium]